mmetsp:Transcript_9658/g.11204  ORF Transcript_9658/g.11204 Transcript_9658/m.11204 type:complete len:287 (-) Transcript_9658:62-922(-)|eukprot:CAMPEP_0197854916 /NCGR_PEP_ID=MMETSP1438-20131217/25580_1 /TAXON_ID=1461541 /ORGANISM="Pterosperma sp., Strain CCMP1384" /LENGTH=286 /DNA_ID=CAMNT_0043469831 /DNA_START=87 /DNA_END=947 /DNA_ORIENTATION=-
MPVTSIFFDLDDTLVYTSDQDKRAHEAVCKLAASRYASLDTQAMLAGFKKRFSKDPWDKAYKVEVTAWRAGLWSQALQEQGVSDEALAADLQTCFDTTRLGHFPWIEGVVPMIKSFKKQGYNLCIITNGHHKVQRDKLKACDAYGLFDHIIVGGEEVLEGRPEKPGKSIFMKACGMVGCKPEEAIHVGDSLGSDIQGAINAGLYGSVFCSRSGKAAAADGPQPTFTVKSVIELPQCLSKMDTAPVPSSGLGKYWMRAVVCATLVVFLANYRVNSGLWNLPTYLKKK